MTKRLSGGALALFSTGQFAAAVISLPIVAMLPPLYAGEFGLGLALTGSIFMFTRLLDAFIDLGLGYAMDRWPTRWGRRKPWMGAAVPILAVSIIAVFLPFGKPDGTYLAFWLVALYVGFTFLTIAHRTWAAQISSHYTERTRVMGYMEFVFYIGMLTSLAVPAILERFGGDLRMKVAVVGILGVASLPLTLLVIRRTSEPQIDGNGSILSLGALRSLLNRPFAQLLAYDLLGGLAFGTVSALTLFYSKHLLRHPEFGAIFLLALVVGPLFFLPLLGKVSHRFEKHRQLQGLALIALIGVAATMIWPSRTPVLALVGIVVFGGAGGLWQSLLKSCVGDLIDHDRAQTGHERGGMFLALLTFTNKGGLALAVGITYPLLAAIGFDPAGSNDAATIARLGWLFVMLPGGCLVLAALVMRRYPLTREALAASRGGPTLAADSRTDHIA